MYSFASALILELLVISGFLLSLFVMIRKEAKYHSQKPNTHSH